jgi:hypothetical protein
MFFVGFLVRLPTLIERVYWDSDAATAPVIAQTFGHGSVILERFGWFTALWFELLTKPLPLHRQLWEGAPYAFSLVGVALLAWAGWRLSGRWAAAMTATAAVATSPFVGYDVVTMNFHTATWFPMVVLAVYCLWLTGSPPATQIASTLLLVTVLAGTTLASDHLFAFVGVIPFGLTGVLLWFLPRMRAIGGAVVGSAATAFLIAFATTRVSSAAHVGVFPVPQRFAADSDLWPNFGRLLHLVAQLVNGDYFFDASLNASSTLSLVCALLGMAALTAPFFLVRHELRSATPSVSLLVYSGFWSACVGLNCISFVLSSEGTHPGFYLIPVLYGMAATVPLVLSNTPRRRLIASIGIAIVAIASFVNLIGNRPQLLVGLQHLPPVASVADRIVQIAKENHARYGYADYWDASSLTWSEHMAVNVAPVSQCEISQAKTDLCGFYFNVNTDWYKPHQGKTFVLRDQLSNGLRQALPATLGPPTATYNLNNTFTLYLYPYDVARRFIWIPTFKD